jgi:hypothetical protein
MALARPEWLRGGLERRHGRFFLETTDEASVSDRGVRNVAEGGGAVLEIAAEGSVKVPDSGEPTRIVGLVSGLEVMAMLLSLWFVTRGAAGARA